MRLRKAVLIFSLLAVNLAACGRAGAVPSPALDSELAKVGAEAETIVLAGGCFWGMEALFEHLKGVTDVVSGYAGGDAATAHYDQVSTGATGHAEAVQVTYDPSQITLGQILKIYFSVAHDPTQLDRQGPDRGTQYRSEIFSRTPDQKKIAAAYIQQLDAAKVFSSPVVTKIEVLKEFYPAEAYHQDFAKRNPVHPYIVVHDMPKVAALKRDFSALYRD